MSTEHHEMVIRIARVTARPGEHAALARAAQANAQDGIDAGAVTAEVCADPDDSDTFIVVSRWPSMKVLQDFLDWHEQHAHESMADHSVAKPTATHYAVLGATTS